MGDDVFVNIAGGMTVDEPASDLGVVAAIASSVRNRPIPATTAMFGEVGWPARSAASRRRRCACARRPRWDSRAASCPRPTSIRRRMPAGGCELVGVRTVGEALDAPARVTVRWPCIAWTARSLLAVICGNARLAHGLARSVAGGPGWPGSRSRGSSSLPRSPTPRRCSSRCRSACRPTSPSRCVLAGLVVALRERSCASTAPTRILGALLGAHRRPGDRPRHRGRPVLDRHRRPPRRVPPQLPADRAAVPRPGARRRRTASGSSRRGSWRCSGAAVPSAATRFSTPASSSTAASPTSARPASSTARWSFRSSC